MAVWDCFLFNDELELLELRLALLNGVVDRFVLVEADRTHQGQPKPLYYARNRARFEAYDDKIVHVAASLPPAGAELEPWHREQLQHRALADAIRAARAEDLVLVGDVDELPFPAVVLALDRTLAEPTRLHMRHAILYANHELGRCWLDGTKACRASHRSSAEMRILFGERPGPYAPGMAPDPDGRAVSDAGWHISFVGGPDAIRAKLAAFTHYDWNLPLVVGGEHLERCDLLGIDFLGRYMTSPRDPRTLADDIQSLVKREAPHLLDHRRPRRAPLRHGYLRWARWRLKAPQRLVAAVERTPGLPYLAGLALLPFDMALHSTVAFLHRHRLRARLRRLVWRTGRPGS